MQRCSDYTQQLFGHQSKDAGKGGQASPENPKRVHKDRRRDPRYRYCRSPYSTERESRELFQQACGQACDLENVHCRLTNHGVGGRQSLPGQRRQQGERASG